MALCRFCLLGTSQHAPPPLLCDCVRRVESSRVESLTYGTLFSPHVLVASVVVIVIANATLVRTKNVEETREGEEESRYALSLSAPCFCCYPPKSKLILSHWILRNGIDTSHIARIGRWRRGRRSRDHSKEARNGMFFSFFLFQRTHAASDRGSTNVYLLLP